ncbi:MULTISPECIES: branched-chain amino acid ABC transporter permease [Mesorhizobium]|uniref:Branched-chain amino acid transport system permease protein n=1 Tax=Mesorhizobium shonense TaxID=1209948 RepID=A0ABV2HMB5_9HYPH|nr:MULTISPECIES: branched-chain amino acid ABC transporter permease [unclassified Mesorhizobium]AZO31913.1 branched-chain amino acid ABC transporter permease [Mesorhizobium sp. M1B.F.Ca.ET.045.04.1.1]RWA67305.1 MAG: branched-chain amino acid ABC transporter permease [Mesorhizobium sp.]RWA79124.1 MAG: branched-chain amino acid ABC transporter permease [Mesorhizobium sp.]RWB21056.1 MAG: branched-chain amino acid ABC transporter permease [Mesorhizobium sp.]RWE02854.1 MAG: branched-chain amino aci
MSYFLLLAVNGLVIGLIYALTAAGLTLVFSVLKVVNFGHGSLYMLGGYASYYIITALHVPPLVGVAGAMVALFIFGVVFERLVIAPMYTDKVERKDEYAIIVTFGLTILLTNLGLVVFGPFAKSPPSFMTGALILGPLILPYDRLIAAVTAVVLLVGLALFLKRTSLGQALDAVSQSRESAAVIGIDPLRMYTVAFGLGSALAGGAGALIAPIFALSPSMGDLPAVQAFIIIVLGGMGSVGGSIAGGILLGLVQGLGVGYLPDPNRALAYTQAFGALLLVVTLLVRPTGLFGRSHLRLE